MPIMLQNYNISRSRQTKPAQNSAPRRRIRAIHVLAQFIAPSRLAPLRRRIRAIPVGAIPRAPSRLAPLLTRAQRCYFLRREVQFVVNRGRGARHEAPLPGQSTPTNACRRYALVVSIHSFIPGMRTALYGAVAIPQKLQYFQNYSD
jgi:hypothetical protein